MDNLDPRVRSSLGEEELVFPPYNALQLQDILRQRADEAFKEEALEPGVIEKCAAFAARVHGDARRALDLLRVAGDLAEREGKEKISEAHIDAANQKIERDKVLDVIESAPKQFQIVVQAIINLNERKEKERARNKGKAIEEEGEMFTGDVYNDYQQICELTKNEVLTQRRISDILGELDMLGIINSSVISKGRQGRTREIKLMLNDTIRNRAKEIIAKSLDL